MTVYYVDFTAGSDAAAGTSEGTAWKTIAKVNGIAFAAGDSILFKKGKVWRETLWPSDSGAAGNPITFGAYGSGAAPQILGADVLSSWTSEVVGSFTAYYATQATDPVRAFSDGVSLTAAASKAELTAGSFWWDDPTNRLYVRLAGDANPSGHTIEAGQRWRAIEIHALSHLVFNGLTIGRTTHSAMWIRETCSDISFTDCRATGAGADGFSIDPGFLSGYLAADISFTDCVADDNTSCGIFLAGEVNGALVHGCETYDNCKAGSEPFAAGIRSISDSGSACSNIIVEDCYSHDNGTNNGSTTAGNGTYFDTPGEGCIARRNRCVDNNRSGIWVEDNASNAPGGVEIVCNIASGGQHGIELYRNVHNNLVAHNVVMVGADGQEAILVYGNGAAASVVDNIVRNNIAIGVGVSLRAYEGGDNDGTKGSGNRYDHNCFGPEQTYLVAWGGYNSHYGTYAAWEAVAGQQHSVEADPAFVDAASGDFRLQPASPCIAAGINLGAGGPIAAFDHVPYGTSPDVGAFSRLSGATLDFSKPFLGLSFPGGTVAEITLWPTAKSVDELKSLTTPG